MVNYLNIIGNMGQRVNPGFVTGVGSLDDTNPDFGTSNRDLLNAMASAGYGKTGTMQTALNDIKNNSSGWTKMNQILGGSFLPTISAQNLDPRVPQSFLQGADPTANNPALGVPNTQAANAMANLGLGTQGTMDTALNSVNTNPTLLAQMNQILGTSYTPPPFTPTLSPPPASVPAPSPSPAPAAAQPQTSARPTHIIKNNHLPPTLAYVDNGEFVYGRGITEKP